MTKTKAPSAMREVVETHGWSAVYPFTVGVIQSITEDSTTRADEKLARIESVISELCELSNETA